MWISVLSATCLEAGPVQHQLDTSPHMRCPAFVAGNGPHGVGQPPESLLEITALKTRQALVCRSVLAFQQVADVCKDRRQGRIGVGQRGTEIGSGFRGLAAPFVNHAQKQLAPPGDKVAFTGHRQGLLKVAEPGMRIDELGEGQGIVGSVGRSFAEGGQ